jgi:flagellar biosynthesis protein FlhF
MRIKKIQAKNFRQALSLVKKELGPDAVILSSEDRKGKNTYVEVTAAIDDVVETNVQEKYAAASTYGAANSGTVTGGNEYAELRKEMQYLRESIDSMRGSCFEPQLPEERKNMFHFLKERSIKDEFALKLIERAADSEELRSAIHNDLNTLTGISNAGKPAYRNDRRAVMLIGPTGSGKTTTIAKLASQAIREGKKVGLISMDTYKVGATEQIRIYARMIGIPLSVVSNIEILQKSIDGYTDRDVVLIDTTGQNPSDSEYIDGLRRIYETGYPIETQLLLSTSSDNDFLMESHKHYNALPIDYVAFTKTDEAVKLGSIYNLCRLYQKPVAYVTNGQRVPGNIEFVDSNRLTNLILRTGSA